MTLLAAYTTVETIDDARRLARAAVEARLAACVQIDRIESFYTWKDQLENGAEFRIVFKTTRASYPDLEALLTRIHPYALPAIYAVEVAHATAGYAAWVAGQTRGGPP